MTSSVLTGFCATGWGVLDNYEVVRKIGTFTSHKWNLDRSDRPF